ncbi:lipid A export permease/ATP-binding protein MsbA [Burkholderiales bacterium JOSHI_001]|nr:lipid A export permease/ATP-binding protein MsbA [Burkholderiales bacterium JOSHI_001]
MSSLLQRFGRIAPYFAQGRAGLVAAAMGALVAAATEPAIPALMKPLLDRGFSSASLPLWMVPVAIIGLFVIRGLAGFIAQYGLAWAANRGVQNLREGMFQRLVTAQPALFSRYSASSLTNTLVYEAQNGSNLLVSALLTLVKDTLTLLALLCYLLWLNWSLTLFVAVLLPAVGLAMRHIGHRLRRLAQNTQTATDELAYTVEENVQAWRLVRLHGAGASQAQRFRDQSQRLRQLILKSVVASGTMTPLTQMLAAVALSAVIVVALWQSQGASNATVGGFVAFVTAMLMLVAPMKHLSDVTTPIVRGLVSVERGIELIESSPAEVGGSHQVARAQGRVKLQDVSLRYRDDQAAALDKVTLEFNPGETVALVGPSGAGKSSLIHLLPRFVDPTGGQVLLDGVPLADWDVAALRRQFALVSQDVVLFNDSVAANVALGGDLDEERVRAALAGANLLAFAQGLPQGIHTLVGHNGNQLSGGQRQRMAIARAIYKDAPVLILDEATSALDSESEHAVQQALELLMKQRTTIVIAHRLSTIERAHRIVTLDAGRVVEQGTHAQLLAAGGLYARLHAMQFRS